MSMTVAQIYALNPSTTILNNDLIYMVQSPYTPGSDTAISGADLISQLTPTGAALSRTNDTNVTLTLGGSPLTALLAATSLTLGWTGLLSGTRGGTGVNNGTSLITVGGNFTMSGAFGFTGTLTGLTAVTFPTSGTLATTSQIPSVTPAALTKTDDTNVTLTLGGTPTTALLQATSLTLGWTGVLSGARGGTGVNNGASTITLGGSLTTSGAFASTFTMTGVTGVTFPTSGTLGTTINILNNAYSYATGGGPANVYTAALSPAAVAYTTGMHVIIKPVNTNTGASTLNVNSLGAQAIRRADGATLAAGDIVGGMMAELNFDGSNFQLLNPARGVLGTATNNNAIAGYVGEFVSAQVAFASRVNVTTTNTPQDSTSISLTAGDWDVSGGVRFDGNGSTSTSYICWCSTTSATLPDLSLVSQINLIGLLSESIPTQVTRISISATTTVYLSAQATFSAGNPQICGFISARRVR